MKEKLAEKLAQGALRGWFNDPSGFQDMRERGNRKAMKAILALLNESKITCVNCGCDAEVADKGRIINRAAYLGSQIISMRERIAEWEKQARKTPPKTLVAERKKVEQAKEYLVRAKPELENMVVEWTTLKSILGWQ